MTDSGRVRLLWNQTKMASVSVQAGIHSSLQGRTRTRIIASYGTITQKQASEPERLVWMPTTRAHIMTQRPE